MQEKLVYKVSLLNFGASVTVGVTALVAIACWLTVFIQDQCWASESDCGGPFTVMIVSSVSALVCMAGQAAASMHVLRCVKFSASTHALFGAHCG